MKEFLNTLSTLLIPLMLTVVLLHALIKKVNPYEVFVDGAKEGISTAFRIIPYLIAIMVSVSMFRASGAIDVIAEALKTPLEFLKIPVDSLPIMITRSMSGSATLGLFAEIAEKAGGNSYATKLSAVIVGSSETTFYVLAVYFGAIGIKKIRFALLVGLLADVLGIIAAIIVSRFFFL